MGERYFENEVFTDLKIENELLSGYKFIDCEFHGCSLSECKLTGCFFSGCRFFYCNASSLQTEFSEMKYGEFTDCVLLGVNWDTLMPNSKFADPIHKLSNCRLRYNHFMNMNFKKFDFSGSEFSGSMFAECSLPESNFRGCLLKETEFFKCDLRNADFRDAEGYKVDILSCKLRGARFSAPEVIRLLSPLGIRID